MEESHCFAIATIPPGILVNPDVRLFEPSPGLQRRFPRGIAHEQEPALMSEKSTGSRLLAVARHYHELGLKCLAAEDCMDLSVFVLEALPAAKAPNLMVGQNQVPANA